MLLALLIAAAGWQPVSDKDGVIVEARELAGKPFKEHRATAHSAHAIEKFDAFFKDKFAQLKDSRITRQVIEKSPDRMVYYDHLKMPIGSDRAYALEYKRSFDPQTKVLEWRFHKIDLKDPPPCDGCVNMPDIHGSWTFSPSESGGTDILYVVYSDPGGDFPKFMVAGKQADACSERLRGVLSQLGK